MGDSEEETAEEKRLRLAKKYLEEIERQGINLLDVSLYYYNQKIILLSSDSKIPNQIHHDLKCTIFRERKDW